MVSYVLNHSHVFNAPSNQQVLTLSTNVHSNHLHSLHTNYDTYPFPWVVHLCSCEREGKLAGVESRLPCVKPSVIGCGSLTTPVIMGFQCALVGAG